jgi:hypothetical protein
MAGAVADVIAAHLEEWRPGPAHVELAIFGTDDPAAIAAMLDQFCRQHLGAATEGALFHQSSIGSVTGLVLSRGRQVVVKGQQPERPAALLAELVRVQRYLGARGLFATPVLCGPAPLGHGQAIVEAFVDAGASADAHDPPVRRALVRSLFQIVSACRPLVGQAALPAHLFSTAPAGELWPRPHSRLFDFAATAAGAAWIDGVAAAAREQRTPSGDQVIGHGDWRGEHLRLAGGQVAAAFDWDSLVCEPEAALVGMTAHAFTADWSRSDRRQAPTLEEARALVADWEQARGRPFTSAERRLCGAAFAYAVAYTARCGYAVAGDERDRPGTFQHLLAQYGPALLEL